MYLSKKEIKIKINQSVANLMHAYEERIMMIFPHLLDGTNVKNVIKKNLIAVQMRLQTYQNLSETKFL